VGGADSRFSLKSFGSTRRDRRGRGFWRLVTPAPFAFLTFRRGQPACRRSVRPQADGLQKSKFHVTLVLALFSLEDTMMTMSDAAMRTIVDIPEKQLDALAQLCAQQNISRAEAVRRAVDRLLKESSTPRKDAGFGIWKSKRIEGRKFVEKLRAEWSER